MPSGELRELVALEQLTETDDGRGNVTITWVERVRAPARFQYLRGTESVMQARLQGHQPVVVTVRWQQALASMDTAWRARDVRSGAVWQIRSISPNERRSYIDILCQTEIAT